MYPILETPKTLEDYNEFYYARRDAGEPFIKIEKRGRRYCVGWDAITLPWRQFDEMRYTSSLPAYRTIEHLGKMAFTSASLGVGAIEKIATLDDARIVAEAMAEAMAEVLRNRKPCLPAGREPSV